MSTYGYSTKKNVKTKLSSKSLWLLFGLIAPFLLWSAFQMALFNGQRSSFEQSIYTAVLISALIGIVACATSSKYLKWSSHKDTLTLLVLLFPISYGISIFNAASEYYAINMLLIMTMYVILYVSSSIMTQGDKLNRVFNLFLLGLAYLIVIFGLFHWLGNGSFVHSFVKWTGSPTSIPGDYLPAGTYRDAVRLEPAGIRLTSVFQYANTYAAFLMAFLFAALFYVGASRKCWEKALHSFMLVPIILSIPLTLSRGGLVLLPVVLLFLLLFLKPYRQLMWVIHLVVSGIIALAISSPVTQIGTVVQTNFSASQSLKGWAYILVGAVLSSAILLALEKWLSPWLEHKLSGLGNKKWGTLLLPIGGIVIGALLLFIVMGTSVKNILPDSVQSRLENINLEQHSVLERLTFYKDSAKLLADYPLFGAGGGAWGVMYEQYQNNPYTSRQAHSFYMQYFDEVGIIGFTLFAAFLIYIFYQYIRTFIRVNQEKRDNYFGYFIIASSILVHSAMDFNMSYAFIGILVFISLGGMTAFIETKPFSKLKWKPNTYAATSAAIYGIISVVLLFTSISYISAASSYKNSLELGKTSNDYNAISAPLDKALSIRPHQPNYVDMKVSMDTQIYVQLKDEQFYDSAYNHLNEAIKAEPYNKTLYYRLIALYETKQLKQEIYNVYEENLFRYPWDITWYEGYMRAATPMATLSLEDAVAKTKYVNAIFDSLKKIEAGIEHLKTLPEGQLQGRPFEVTQKVALYIGQAYYLNGQTQEAYDLLKMRLQEPLVIVSESNPNDVDTTNLEIMRWYLAASQKLGLKDEANLAKIIAQNPNEEAAIQAVVNLKVQ